MEAHSWSHSNRIAASVREHPWGRSPRTLDLPTSMTPKRGRHACTWITCWPVQMSAGQYMSGAACLTHPLICATKEHKRVRPWQPVSWHRNTGLLQQQSNTTRARAPPHGWGHSVLRVGPRLSAILGPLTSDFAWRGASTWIGRSRRRPRTSVEEWAANHINNVLQRVPQIDPWHRSDLLRMRGIPPSLECRPLPTLWCVDLHHVFALA